MHVSAHVSIRVIDDEIPTCSNPFGFLILDINSQLPSDEGSNSSDDLEIQSLSGTARVNTSK